MIEPKPVRENGKCFLEYIKLNGTPIFFEGEITETETVTPLMERIIVENSIFPRGNNPVPLKFNRIVSENGEAW